MCVPESTVNTNHSGISLAGYHHRLRKSGETNERTGKIDVNVAEADVVNEAGGHDTEMITGLSERPCETACDTRETSKAAAPSTEDTESMIGPTGQTTVRCPDNARIGVQKDTEQTHEEREAESESVIGPTGQTTVRCPDSSRIGVQKDTEQTQGESEAESEPVIGPTRQTTVRCPDSTRIGVQKDTEQTQGEREAESELSECILSITSRTCKKSRKTFCLEGSPLKHKPDTNHDTEEDIRLAASLIQAGKEDSGHEGKEAGDYSDEDIVENHGSELLAIDHDGEKDGERHGSEDVRDGDRGEENVENHGSEEIQDGGEEENTEEQRREIEQRVLISPNVVKIKRVSDGKIMLEQKVCCSLVQEGDDDQNSDKGYEENIEEVLEEKKEAEQGDKMKTECEIKKESTSRHTKDEGSLGCILPSIDIVGPPSVDMEVLMDEGEEEEEQQVAIKKRGRKRKSSDNTASETKRAVTSPRESYVANGDSQIIDCQVVLDRLSYKMHDSLKSHISETCNENQAKTIINLEKQSVSSESTQNPNEEATIPQYSLSASDIVADSEQPLKPSRRNRQKQKSPKDKAPSVKSSVSVDLCTSSSENNSVSLLQTAKSQITHKPQEHKAVPIIQDEQSTQKEKKARPKMKNKRQKVSCSSDSDSDVEERRKKGSGVHAVRGLAARKCKQLDKVSDSGRSSMSSPVNTSQVNHKQDGCCTQRRNKDLSGGFTSPGHIADTPVQRLASMKQVKTVVEETPLMNLKLSECHEVGMEDNADCQVVEVEEEETEEILSENEVRRSGRSRASSMEDSTNMVPPTPSLPKVAVNLAHKNPTFEDLPQVKGTQMQPPVNDTQRESSVNDTQREPSVKHTQMEPPVKDKDIGREPQVKIKQRESGNFKIPAPPSLQRETGDFEESEESESLLPQKCSHRSLSTKKKKSTKGKIIEIIIDDEDDEEVVEVFNEAVEHKEMINTIASLDKDVFAAESDSDDGQRDECPDREMAPPTLDDLDQGE